ncbi:MAG: TMEM175 family protein [Chloroflexota bacterium]
MRRDRLKLALVDDWGDMAMAGSDNDTTRLEAFSDGVFAIAITLLVLDIKVPTTEEASAAGLLSELLERWPNFLAFVASFFFILVMWINHHRLFKVIRRTDHNLMLLNGLLLLGVTLVPFPTALVAEYLNHPDETVAALFYNGWFLLIAIFFNLLWRYASHNNRLFTAATDKALVARISQRYTYGAPAYALAILLALVSPLLSLLLNLLMAFFFALPTADMEQMIDEAQA